MKKPSLSTILSPRDVLVPLTLVLVVQLAVGGAARAEYIQKTFSATFDDGTVMTGTFAGDPGDDGILTFSLSEFNAGEVQELNHFALQTFVPNRLEGPVFRTAEFTYPSSDYWGVPDIFRYDPHVETLYFLSIGRWGPSYGLAYNMPPLPLTYDYDFKTVYASGVTVTIADADDGVVFEWIEADIAAGLAAGMFDTEGTARSLTNMLQAAGAALEQGNPDTALQILEAFIHRVEFHYGKHMTPLMAEILLFDAHELVSILSE